MNREIPLPELSHIERYYHYASLFSTPECHELIRLAESKDMQEGTIGIGQNQAPRLDHDYRTVHTARILFEDAPWAFDRLIQKVMGVNSEWKFDLCGLREDIGIMRYTPATEGKPHGHYRWHQDFGGGIYSQRKISVVGLLTRPCDFEGGELMISGDRGIETTSLNQQGDVVMFPSWTPHCVTDVTKGTRYSLVAWVSGPRFR